MFKQATLPITMSDGVCLDVREAQKYGENLSRDYCFAELFPHIVIDNFLPEALINKILENFPKEKLKNDVVFEMGYAGLHKRQVAPADCNGFCREIFGFFNSTSIVQFLESLTTRPSLILNPHFVGGRFH